MVRPVTSARLVTASSKTLTLASRSDSALRSAQCRFRRRGNTTDNCYTGA
jgi:hypothetical protein